MVSSLAVQPLRDDANVVNMGDTNRKSTRLSKRIGEGQPRLVIAFHEHVPTGRAASLVQNLDPYGLIEPGPTDRTFYVDLYREAIPKYLDELLIRWDRIGLLRWYIEPKI